jgi:tetratricopeptide (TPR) repeat protein
MINFAARRQALLAAALTCAVTVGAGMARAEAPAELGGDAARARARALLQEGASFMDERQYDRAVDAFREAYRLVPSPKVLYNLAIAYLSVARYADALAALEKFLAEATDAPEANRETARRHIADLRGKVTALAVTSDRPRAELVLDGRSLGEVALDHDLTIDAGPHDLRAVSNGRVIEQRLTAPPGGRVAVTLSFDGPIPGAAPPAASAPAGPPGLALSGAPEESPSLTRRPWFWVAASCALAAVATVVLLVALGGTEYPTPDATVPGP